MEVRCLLLEKQPLIFEFSLLLMDNASGKYKIALLPYCLIALLGEGMEISESPRIIDDIDDLDNLQKSAKQKKMFLFEETN